MSVPVPVPVPVSVPVSVSVADDNSPQELTAEEVEVEVEVEAGVASEPLRPAQRLLLPAAKPRRLSRWLFGSSSSSSSSSRRRRRRGRWCDSSFLKSPLYLAALLSSVLGLGTCICFVFLVLDFADHSGWTLRDGVFLNFVFMLSTLGGRALLAVVSLRRGVSSLALLGVTGLVGGVGVCLVGQVSQGSFSPRCLLYAFVCVCLVSQVSQCLFPLFLARFCRCVFG